MSITEADKVSISAATLWQVKDFAMGGGSYSIGLP